MVDASYCCSKVVVVTAGVKVTITRDYALDSR
jgi:hypothetical protein